jgi:DNA-binding Xre family transcriptional regulator
MERFNENVELICAKRGIRKKELIAHIGISRSAFYAKLAGVRPWFLDEAVKVADFLGVGIGELVA